MRRGCSRPGRPKRRTLSNVRRHRRTSSHRQRSTRARWSAASNAATAGCVLSPAVAFPSASVGGCDARSTDASAAMTSWLPHASCAAASATTCAVASSNADITSCTVAAVTWPNISTRRTPSWASLIADMMSLRSEIPPVGVVIQLVMMIPGSGIGDII